MNIKEWMNKYIYHRDYEDRISKLEARVFKEPDRIGFEVDCSESQEREANWDSNFTPFMWEGDDV